MEHEQKGQRYVNDIVLGESFALMHKLFNALTVNAVSAFLAEGAIVRLALKSAVDTEEEGPRKRLLENVQRLIDGYTAQGSSDELERYRHVIRPVQRKIEELIE